MKLGKTLEDFETYGIKYQFYYNEDKNSVVCTTVYKGQTIRAIAKCDPEDTFNLEVGKKIAYLRCKQKFARKKLIHAGAVYRDSFSKYERSKRNLDKAAEFVSDSVHQLKEANEALVNCVDNI